MSLHADQLFVKSKSLDAVVEFVRKYVSEYGTRFVPHSHVKLDGVEQTLKGLIRRRRKFILYNKKEWTVIWERVHYSSFADPDIAKFVSKQLETKAIRIDFDDNYNIWAYQVFDRGEVVDESFLPESYFVGDHEATDFDEYGSCHDFAEEFNSHWQLPAFLVTLSQLERSPSKFRGLTEIKCQLNDSP